MSLPDHKLSACMKRLVPCTREGCADLVPVTELDHHLKNECKERQIFCRYGCQKVLIVRVSVPKHGLQIH